MPSMRPARIAVLLAFAAALGAVTWGALLLTRQADSVAAVWPANPLIAAVLVRWARDRTEQAAVFVASAVVLVAANMVCGSSPGMAAAMVGFNLVEVALAAWLLRRVGPPIESPRAFGAFVLGPVVGAPVTAAACAALLFAVAVPGSNPMQVFLRWSFADGLGMAIIGSFALTVGRARSRPTGRAGWIRFAVAQAVMLAASVFILTAFRTPPLFLLAPFLVMGALSHRELGGITSVVIIAVLAMATNVLGLGAASVASLAQVDRVMLMQLLLATMVFTVLPVSSLLRRLELYEIELDDRRARAEELNALKSRLLAYVGHEIRSPLSGVASLAGLMRDGVMGELTPAQQDTLAQIASTGAEVEALARDLTDAAAIEAGKASVRLASVSVAEAIAASIDLARFRTAQHRAEVLTVAGDADAMQVAADPLRLRQILVNLLVNGAKYGGRPPVVSISARLTGAGHVRFEVTDNGVGVPAERRGDLFGAFERLGAEATGIEGVGLGLALCHEMARLQHGRLGVDDAAGGARFWLELPLWSQEAVAA